MAKRTNKFGNINIQPAETLEAEEIRFQAPQRSQTPSVQKPTTEAPVADEIRFQPPQRTTAPKAPALSPVVALEKTRNPPVASPVYLPPVRQPVSRVTSADLQEETLSLDTFTYVNGKAAPSVSSLRAEIVSLVDFKPAFAEEGNSKTVAGVYLDDLYQSSIIQDTLRRYLLLNKTASDPGFSAALGRIAGRLNSDIASAAVIIQNLDTLTAKTKELETVLDLKKSLEGNYAFSPPNVDIRGFVTQRLLFPERAYQTFSDTKIAYQVLSDLGGMLQRCSFGLLDGFVDADRTNPAQDSITLDLTYGDGVRFTPEDIRGKYINDFQSFNGVLGSLPTGNSNRLKFILNLLSREFKVSKGLGKYKLPTEAQFFGFGNRGNPFDNVLGSVPSDIFLSPGGANSLASLFYLKTGTQNVVVLPLESKQVSGDGETVFLPGSAYFADGILNGDPATFFSYRETFSERIARAITAFDSLLLQQTARDSSSAPLEPIALLRAALSSYLESQSLIRRDNGDPLTALTFALFAIGKQKPRLKYEVFKTLMLLAAYDSRPIVSSDIPQTDRFRDLLFSEIALGGSGEPVTEEKLPKVVETQLEALISLLVANTATSATGGKGLQSNQDKSRKQTAQVQALGLPEAPLVIPAANTTDNVMLAQIQQLSRMIYGLRGNSNLFKNVVEFARSLFAASSTNDVQHHLVEGSTATRFSGLTMTGALLLSFEVFEALVTEFASSNLSFSLEDGAGAKDAGTRYLRVEYVGDELERTANDIRLFLGNGTYNNASIRNWSTSLAQELATIRNGLLLFSTLSARLSGISVPSFAELTALKTIEPTGRTTPSSLRTAKAILRSTIDKRSATNPTASRSLEFYLPSGKMVSRKNWLATTACLATSPFRQSRKKIVTVGVPAGFVDAALGATLSREGSRAGALNEAGGTDSLSVSVFKLDRREDGVIYKPQSFQFDLSLFPSGFDFYDDNFIARRSYDELFALFRLYDFDEDVPFAETVSQTTAEFLASDPFYSLTAQRRQRGEESAKNLFNSFVLSNYLHVLTGMNTSEETFVAYTEEEMARFSSNLQTLQNPTLTKLMSQEYQDLLLPFSGDRNQLKLMLGITNDVLKTTFRSKVYDRVFHVLVDADGFEVDTVAMSENPDTKRLLELLVSSGQLFTDPQTGKVYRKASEFSLESYFVNLELVQP